MSSEENPGFEELMEKFMIEQDKHNYRSYSDNPHYIDLVNFITTLNALKDMLGLSQSALEEEIKSYISQNK